MSAPLDQCCYCLVKFHEPKRDLRPYGPNGAMTCNPCATESPERKAETHRQLERVFAEAGPTATITSEGIMPLAEALKKVGHDG